jgi:hypothetical protein
MSTTMASKPPKSTSKAPKVSKNSNDTKACKDDKSTKNNKNNKNIKDIKKAKGNKALMEKDVESEDDNISETSETIETIKDNNMSDSDDETQENIRPYDGTFRKEPLKQREQVQFALEIIDNISQKFTLEGMSHDALRIMLLSCITNDTRDELEKHLKRAKRLGKVKAEKFIAFNDNGKALHAKSSYILFSKDNRDKVVENNPGLKATEITQELGKMWTSHKEKDSKTYKKYIKLAEEDKTRVNDEYKLQYQDALKNGKIAPPKPKRPKSSYLCFSNSPSRIEDIKKNKLSIGAAAKENGKLWSNLNDKQKEPYIKEANKLKIAYQKECEIWENACKKLNIKNDDSKKSNKREVKDANNSDADANNSDADANNSDADANNSDAERKDDVSGESDED